MLYHRLLLALLLFVGACQNNPVAGDGAHGLNQNTGTVWVDADFACFGAFFADPDDCLALRLLQRARPRIAGISVVAGNSTRAKALSIAQTLAGNVPVYDGVPRCDTEVMRSVQKAAARGDLTILAFGPLTNIAQMLTCDATLAKKITVVAVGGRRPGAELTPNPELAPGVIVRDLNFESDPQALAVVIASGVRMSLIPFEAGNMVPLRVWGDDITGVEEELLSALRRWSFLTSGWWGTDGILPFDPVAATFYLWRNEFHCEMVSIVTRGNRFEAHKTTWSNIEYCLPTRPAVLRTRMIALLNLNTKPNRTFYSGLP